jgi:ParB-like chromosome segregation protein Spo0J
MSDNANIPEIVMIALGDLYVPDWNPRDFMDEGEMLNLVAYLRSGGIVERILVWKDKGQTPRAIISGQRRREAYRRLGRTHIETEILDITLEQAMLMALASNQGVTPYWLEKYKRWERLMTDFKAPQEAWAAKFGCSQQTISRAKALLRVLNEESRGLIRQHLQELAERDKSADDFYAPGVKTGEENVEFGDEQPNRWQFTEKSAKPLTALLTNRSQEEAQALAARAVKVILAQRMTGSQVKELVAWVNSGKDVAQFKLLAKVRKSKVSSSTPQAGTHALGAPIPEEQRIDSSEPGKETPKITAPSHASHVAKPPAENLGTSTMGTAETLALDALAGVSIIGQIKSKLKKKEKVSWGEILLVTGHDIGKALGWVVKHAYKLFKEAFKIVWKVLKHGTKAVSKLFGPTVYRVFNKIMPIAVLIGLGYLAWDIYEHGAVSHPVRFIESQTEQGLSRLKDSIFKPKTDAAVSQPAPPPAGTSQPVASSPASNGNGNNQPLAEPKLAPQSKVSTPAQAPIASKPTVVAAPAGVSAANLNSTPTVSTPLAQATPTVQKTDIVGQAAGSVAQQAGADAAGAVAKKLFGF